MNRFGGTRIKLNKYNNGYFVSIAQSNICFLEYIFLISPYQSSFTIPFTHLVQIITENMHKVTTGSYFIS